MPPRFHRPLFVLRPPLFPTHVRERVPEHSLFGDFLKLGRVVPLLLLRRLRLFESEVDVSRVPEHQSNPCLAPIPLLPVPIMPVLAPIVVVLSEGKLRHLPLPRDGRYPRYSRADRLFQRIHQPERMLGVRSDLIQQRVQRLRLNQETLPARWCWSAGEQYRMHPRRLAGFFVPLK